MELLSRKRETGISLIELMISLSILSITLTSFLSATSAVSKIFYHQRMLTQAIAVGESLTEGLLLLDPSDSDLNTGVYAKYYSIKGSETTIGLATYTAEWVVQSYDPVPGMRELEVSVYWEERGESKDISWITYRN